MGDNSVSLPSFILCIPPWETALFGATDSLTAPQASIPYIT
jgi:hypothetical protein